MEKRLKCGDLGINRLDMIAKRRDIAYACTNILRDKHEADHRMIQAIDRLLGKRTLTEKIVKEIVQIKVKLNV